MTGKKRPEKPASSSTYIPTPANQIPSLMQLDLLPPRQQSQPLRQPIHQPPAAVSAPVPPPAPIVANPTAPTAMKLPSLLPTANPTPASGGSTLSSYLAHNPTNVIRNNTNKRKSDSVVDLVSDSDEDEKEQFVPKPKRKVPLASLISSKIPDSIRDFNNSCNRSKFSHNFYLNNFICLRSQRVIGQDLSGLQTD